MKLQYEPALLCCIRTFLYIVMLNGMKHALL